jgi:hypothetical protein
MTANGDIGAATAFPLLIDPNMPRARSHRAFNAMPGRPYAHIHLSRCRHSAGAYHQKNKKCQFYNFTFHMLVFKYDDWTVHRSVG